MALWVWSIVGVPGLAAAATHSPCIAPAGATPVEFRSGQNVLRGFLDLPPGAGKHPAILIIHGGADSDVTADVPYWKELRKAFERAGIATLLWDKAGNGCSSGRYAGGPLPIQERATEALAALELLQQRPDIDATRIGLWALSQGGWVGPMAAVRSRGIAYLIIVSGPGRDALSLGLYPAVQLLREQGVSDAEADDAYATLRRGLTVLRAGATAQETLDVVAPLRRYPVLRKAYQLDLAGIESMRTFLAQPQWSMSAEVFLEQLDQPTLALFGERDAVVDWRESIEVYRSSFARSGNRDLTIRTFKDADHEMVSLAKPQHADAGFAYADGYIATMIDWLDARHFTNLPPH